MGKNKVKRPNRDPDHYSKRGVAYWWEPDWTRGTSADTSVPKGSQRPEIIYNSAGEPLLPPKSYGRIRAVKERNGEVTLHMVNKDTGKLSYIQGSIQEEFKRWHIDRSIDYILFGISPDEIILWDNE